MLCKAIIAILALASFALAGFDIKTGKTEWWYTDAAEVETFAPS